VCGIVAVVRRRARRDPPALGQVRSRVEEAAARLGDGTVLPDPEALTAAAAALGAADRELRGVPGVRALLDDPAGADRLARSLGAIGAVLEAIDRRFDEATGLDADALEARGAAFVAVRDAHWALACDRLRAAAAVAELGAGLRSPAADEAFTSVHAACSALERLEVRGRDSAGLLVAVTGHGLDLRSPEVAAALARRADPLFRSGAVAAPDGDLVFVYKAAAEIGELGDNVAALRAAIRDDELLHAALAGGDAEAVVLAHTRWASVGIISEANAHPLDSTPAGGPPDAWVAAALNGDVDNHAELVARHRLAVPPEITTDAKVIPMLVAAGLGGGEGPTEAFRSAVAGFEGSVAIAAHTTAARSRVHLALRGSGQALYVGLAEDAFVVASEPYGVVEETDTYLRLDGETPGNPANPAGSRGQVVVVDAGAAGEVAGIERLAYDGTPLPVEPGELVRAPITTRDVDRGPFPHYLLKEISESPQSFRKTLRGRIVTREGRLSVALGREAFPPEVVDRLAAGAIRRVLVIGQGTAAVAGQSLAAMLRRALGPSVLEVEALPATELSGFRLAPDMSDTLVVAISQSGTTTDTNRTVDVVRARGATVLAIVNRRNSDLCDRADGVCYTSDGRDVEMSVASTKAFYAQVAAGILVAHAVADAVGAGDPEERSALLEALRSLPEAMREVLARRDRIAAAAQRHAPARRSWAVVGNGANRIAAQEVRIKCSELCYKSIACDATEDKKHIDLSAEPLILVCAAGLRGSVADDVAKELQIYRAHKAAPIAVVDDGDDRYTAALEVLPVPVTHPDLAFVLATMAGHLFGYEAALAIDASARPLREARAAIEALVAGDGPAPGGEELLAALAAALEGPAARFLDGLAAGVYDGTLEASTAVRLSALLRYALGISPLDAYPLEFGAVGTPATVVEELVRALTRAIEELTRPVDAIKHQAKTVTVGISRADETLLEAPLVRAVLVAGASRDVLSYRVLRTLVELDAAVAEVTGFTRYAIDGDPDSERAGIAVLDRGGVAAGLRSRTETIPVLRGTKQIVAQEREVLVARGRADGRTVLLVPEVKGAQTVGITLLHLRFHDRLPPEVMRGVLSGYRHRYQALRAAVTETEPAFDEDRLGEIDVTDLLTVPVNVLADRWRAAPADR
jgi:glucosamine--fructose-6-phosphate aminotransferase (isomerizing)